ncbi:DUF3696 domain-containing protein [Frankia sp. AgB32]|uniref:AAA family ATPase n=1 Tax=Frankia sp. AgB32 TaxID=631119 RepID=UPI0020106DE8|nr:DUF3696 domain-containing protein [Frankia sp. AgB32]MCK9894570.1 DUF3696 domain-containing protein [Frankia sp. AgB32]
MITNVQIINFKIFRDLDLDLLPLTVLTGLNSSGKSTVIQALLLADLAEDRDGELVPLNGEHGLALGEASDVLYAEAADSAITTVRVIDGQICRTDFAVPDDRAGYLRCERSDRHGPRVPIDTYLSAERLGPRDLLEVSTLDDGRLRVGHRGQYTAHLLARREREQVPVERRHPETVEHDHSITLGGQTGLWLSEIVRPVLVSATWLQGTNAAMIRFRDPDALTPWLRPANVGFGLSYALPICVAGLAARPASLFIVENPEAHLHPAGQSAMGRFLARLAASGVQTIVETHSDHVIDGIRLGVAEERTLPASHAVLHYFGNGERTAVGILESGALTDWPAGFFDQGERDLASLARIRRRSQ